MIKKEASSIGNVIEEDLSVDMYDILEIDEFVLQTNSVCVFNICPVSLVDEQSKDPVTGTGLTVCTEG